MFEIQNSNFFCSFEYNLLKNNYEKKITYYFINCY